MSAIGYFVLVLALVSSLYSLFAYIFSARGRHQALVASARASLLASCILVTVSVGVLLSAILFHNFKIEYVAAYTNYDTSFIYLVSTLWAGNNGSLLFWAWLLSIFAVVVVFRKRNSNRELVPYAAAVIMFTEAFFLILLLSVSNPFHQLAIAPADGRGLNPLLENPGMVLHPPALLAGYVGFTVPFAFAVAALVSKSLGNDWLAAARRWAILSWLLLGVGNLIGAWWAYVELGWGGYWAWDPVENAGLMPWLVATAFLHSAILQRKKGMFKIWNMVLIIITFNLAIFGTFLTRSGFLSSVHTFGESRLGPFFIVFLCITFFGALGWLYYRREELRSQEEVDSLVSRESTFLLNNILLFGATIIIFVGTIFPGLSEAVRGVKIEVGQLFFNRVNGPIFLAIVLLAGICTLIGWQRGLLRDMMKKFLRPLVIAVILSIVLFILGVRQGYATVASFLCSFVFFAILYQWFQETKAYQKLGKGNYFNAGWHLFWSNRPRYGGYLVHIGIVLIAIGVAGSSIYDVEKEASLKPGESMTIRGYTLVYDKIDLREVPSKTIVNTTLSVYRGNTFLYQMRPEKIFHRSYEQPVTEVAIRSNLFEDLYVILAGWDNKGTTTFQVLVNPLVIWLWIGGGVFLLGGLLAFGTGRRQLTARKLDTVATEKASDQREDEIERQVQQLRERRERFCAKCGARYRKGERFCSQCGAALGQGEDIG